MKVHLHKRLFIALGLAGMLAGCSSMSDTQKRTLSGAAIGAAGGALIGEVASGKPLTGAAIGTGVGVAGGWLYDRHKKKKGE